MDESEQNLRQAIASNFFERYQNVFKTSSEAMGNELGKNIKGEFDKKVKELLKVGKISKSAAASPNLTQKECSSLAKMLLLKYPSHQELEWEQGRGLYRRIYQGVVHEKFPSTFKMLMQYMQRKDNVINFLIPQGNSILVPSATGPTIDNEVLGFAMNWEFRSKEDYINSHQVKVEISSSMNDIFEDIAKKAGNNVFRFNQPSFEIIAKYYLQADMEEFF